MTSPLALCYGLGREEPRERSLEQVCDGEKDGWTMAKGSEGERGLEHMLSLASVTSNSIQNAGSMKKT